MHPTRGVRSVSEIVDISPQRLVCCAVAKTFGLVSSPLSSLAWVVNVPYLSPCFVLSCICHWVLMCELCIRKRVLVTFDFSKRNQHQPAVWCLTFNLLYSRHVVLGFWCPWINTRHTALTPASPPIWGKLDGHIFGGNPIRPIPKNPKNPNPNHPI